jgi:ABC-2 type transport system permease protein
MSATAAAPPRQAFAGVASLSTQVGLLARRSLLRTVRKPAQLIPTLVFPLFILAVNASGLRSATNLPGFPTRSYLTFALALPFIQSALFAIINAGTDVVFDLETGFLNRLQLTPVGRAALLIGELAGVVVLAQVAALFYLAVGLTFGAHIAAGVGGVFVLLALAALMSVGFGSLGMFAALRTASGEAVQALFPLFFVVLFLSSIYLPRNLIHSDWFRTVATWNPVSYLLEGIRSVLIIGWDPTALARAFLIAGAIAVLGLTASALVLRSRMGRT